MSAYFNAIPQAGDNPSVSQGQMLINFASLSTWTGVDHVLIGSTGYGTHQQVTFNSNNTPSSPTNPPVLFTKLVNSLGQLFFYSGSAAQSADQYVAAGNGSTMLLGGIIIKWFTVTFTANFQSFSFSSLGVGNFPNNAFGAVIGLQTIPGSAGYSALSTSAITITHSPGSSPITTFVIVIGN